jgi:aryl-alcohol dehydrogenase-like predicted oxidoreductase
MKNGFVDTVQVIYNIFEQQPVAELFPEAIKNNVGIIVRVVFDEGVLTGKYRADSKFPDDDFRNNYFAGDRLERAVRRVEKLKEEFSDTGLSMPQLALKFGLSHEDVSCVSPGIRNVQQAEWNIEVSDLPELSEDILLSLRNHEWRRYFWYSGK